MDADDSTVYVPAWGASVSAVDARTGAARWVWRVPAETQYRVTAQAVRVSGDTVFAAITHDLNTTGNASEGWLFAIDRRDGHELGKATVQWNLFGAVFNASIAVWRHLIIVTGTGGLVWAINRQTYQIDWKYVPPTPSGATIAGPTLFGDVVYTDGGANTLVGLAAANGSVVWKAKIMSQASSDLYVTPARVYAPEFGFLNIIDRHTGRYVARVQKFFPNSDGSSFSTTPISYGDQVYVGVNGGAWCFDEP